MNLAAIAAALDARLIGDGTIEIARTVHPADAEGSADLALAMDRKTLALLDASRARAAIVAEGAVVPEGRLDGCIVVGRPRYALAGVLDLFDQPVHAEPGIHATAVIAADAVIGADVRIGPFVVIGPRAVVGAGTIVMAHVTIGADARVGAGCRIHPGARIGDRVAVGDRVILHHNVSLGADGFSFVTPEAGSVESAKATGRVEATNVTLRRINSIGTVIVGDDVEIGANSAVDRGTVSATRIGRGTKIDNLVQIGHNVVIGETCMLCGQVGIAGSAVIGNRVVLAGKVGVGDHVRIGDDAVVGAASAVGTDVAPKSVVMGMPAMPRQRFFDQMTYLHRLKNLFGDVADLKSRLKRVESLSEKD